MSQLSNFDKSPKFITLEGGEGVGKTTATDGLCAFLEEQGVPFVRTREPGGSAIGETLRKIFLNPANHLSADSELLMIFSARTDHLDKVILPALQAGKWVVCDRFLDSTVAYQAFGRWGDNPDELAKMIKKINELAHGFLPRLPDIRFWLDLEPSIGRERAKGRGELDRLEREPPEFYARVYQGFAHQYAHANADGSMKRIDAGGLPKEVLASILAHL